MTEATEVRYGEPVDVLREGWDADLVLAQIVAVVWGVSGKLTFRPSNEPRDFVALRDAIDAALLRVRYAYVDCPNGVPGFCEPWCAAVDGQCDDPGCPALPCDLCSDSDRWGIPAGCVRVRDENGDYLKVET